MTAPKRPWFRLMTHKDYSQAVRTPTAQESIDLLLIEMTSRYPIREIGWASDQRMILTEEDRESHIHILGAPGEGKSRLIELLVRQDIQRGYPVCLLDPSDNADTAYNILRWCIKHGFEKVCLIDPHDFIKFAAVPTINPFGKLTQRKDGRVGYITSPEAAAGDLMDTFRVLWGAKTFDETPRITKYLEALIILLHQANCTLSDSLLFTSRDKTHAWHALRCEIFDRLPPYFEAVRLALEPVFFTRSQQAWIEFESTVRRLTPLFNSRLRQVLGSTKSPLPFTKMISDGWVILVNLYPALVWGDAHQRFLGTLVINECLTAVDVLRSHGWHGRFYLYIDEVGDYATRKIAQLITKKRKSGVALTVAHQAYDQIEDAYVRNAIQAAMKIKVLFYTASRQDRDRMLRDMYGGDIPDRQVSFVLSQLEKQKAAIKVNKQAAREVMISDVPDVQIPPTVLNSFKEKLYSYPWFFSPTEISKERHERFKEGQPPPARPSRKQTPTKKTQPPADLADSGTVEHGLSLRRSKNKRGAK